jgi:hypothetical protein
MSEEIRSLLRADWVGKLADYGIDEIDRAIGQYVDNVQNRKAPHEGQIKHLILINRKADLDRQPKPEIKPAPERAPITDDQRKRAIDLLVKTGFQRAT